MLPPGDLSLCNLANGPEQQYNKLSISQYARFHHDLSHLSITSYPNVHCIDKYLQLWLKCLSIWWVLIRQYASLKMTSIIVGIPAKHNSPKMEVHTLREESSQTNVILQYKLLAAILSAVCSVIQ